MKKKIALIVDVDNWAFANIAKNISRLLSEKFDFKIIPMANIEDNIVKMLFLVKDYDLIHFFWRGHLTYIDNYFSNNYIKSLGGNPEEFYENYFNKKIISTSVYDHLFLSDDDMEITNKLFSVYENYYVSSERLNKIYKKNDKIFSPKAVITDGVNLEAFFPINLDRFKNIGKRKIVIGWVGNSKWVDCVEDFKGVNSILIPAINELISEGYPLEMYFADKNVRMIPHDKMNEYYSKIDLYICSSKIEGTPNPVLESMACGIPIISTDVGIVPEVFGKKQKQFILKNRDKDSLKKKITELVSNPDLLIELSNENQREIRKWTWDEKAKQFESFFDNCLKGE